MAIARDGSSSFPVSTGNTGTLQAITTATFSAAAGSVLVICIGYENQVGTDVGSMTASWAAGGSGTKPTLNKRVESVSSPSKNGFGQIWTATTTDALSGVAITATAGVSASNVSITVAVDALTGATENGGASNTAFHSGSGANSITVAGVSSGSWVYVADWSEVNATYTPVTDTTEIREDASTGAARSAVGVNTTGTSGDILVGWGTSDTYNGQVALEIEVTAATTMSAAETDSTEADDFYAIGWNAPVGTAFQDFLQGNAFQVFGGGAAAPGAYGFSETDSAPASDAQASKTGIPGFAETDTTTATDPQAMGVRFPSSETDLAPASDTDDAKFGIRYSQTDTATATDQQGSLVGIPSRSQTDSSAASDQEAAAFGIRNSETDTVTLSDAWTLDVEDEPETGISVSEADSTAVSDVDALGTYIAKAITEATALADQWAIAVSSAAALAQTDTAALSDSQAVAIARAVAQTDVITASDIQAVAVAATGVIQGRQTDTLTLSDSYAVAVERTVPITRRFHVWDGSGWV